MCVRGRERYVYEGEGMSERNRKHPEIKRDGGLENRTKRYCVANLEFSVFYRI